MCHVCPGSYGRKRVRFESMLEKVNHKVFKVIHQIINHNVYVSEIAVNI